MHTGLVVAGALREKVISVRSNACSATAGCLGRFISQPFAARWTVKMRRYS
jgi:hypothetical protein